MTFAEWLQEQDRNRPGGKGTLSEMMWETKISHATLHRAKRGRPVSRRVAVAICEHTRGAVSAESLMAGAQTPKRARKRKAAKR